MNTKIIVIGSLLAFAASADTYQDLERVNEQMRAHIAARNGQLSAGGLSPEQTTQLQQQNAADQQALDGNKGTTRAVRAKDPGRGAASDTMMMMMMANQANQAAAASQKKSSSSSGGGDSKPATPNPNFQVQKLDVPEAKFDTSVPTDSPLLGELQDKIKGLGKVLQEPVDTKQMSISASIDKEIADLQAANETRITLMRAAAAFAAGAEKERASKKAPEPPKSFADELKSLEKGGTKGEGLNQAIQALDATVVPAPQASRRKGDSSTTPPNSGGHVDTLSGNKAPPAEGYDPKVIDKRDSPAK